MNQLITTDKIPLPIIILYTYTVSNTVITRDEKFMYVSSLKKNLWTGILMCRF